MVITIDPGKRIGWALAWRPRPRKGYQIYDAGTVGDVADLPDAEIAIIEMPRVYPSRNKWRGDPQDIVGVAFVAGMVAGQYRDYVAVEPHVWRGGNAPKRAVHRRIIAALDDDERSRIGRTSEHSRDAIGIALWYAERRF